MAEEQAHSAGTVADGGHHAVAAGGIGREDDEATGHDGASSVAGAPGRPLARTIEDRGDPVEKGLQRHGLQEVALDAERFLSGH